MSIDFFHPENRNACSGRLASREWREAIRNLFDPKSRQAADIGCGGGIYTRALADLGAHVTGVDPSPVMLEAAREKSTGYETIRWRLGKAEQTGLMDQSFDIVLLRAVIHHLTDLSGCFRELFRILKPGGMILVQDRTPDDVTLPPSGEHLRGMFFEIFPRLKVQECARRHPSDRVKSAMINAGFLPPSQRKLWETRTVHPTPAALEKDLLRRTGRSILHKLSNEELKQLAFAIRRRLQSEGRTGPIPDRDRWTLWWAKKEAS
ncbi:class I SAM-dependent methyltransferase [Melghirimyces profundicolus]|uniref:class I SAM-dependent methyltransferase n=1 Tax=Melghirimyces profundicolus TaxID=1242148 RepID=UPI001475B76B|nr:class I SAM-dependent methyltransferase [Melghirimyces profundicolus]